MFYKKLGELALISLLYCFFVVFIFGIYSFNWHNFYDYMPPGDPVAYIWLFEWFKYCYLHLVNPFLSYKILLPVGVNVAWASPSSFFPSIVSIPISLVYGGSTSYFIWLLISPVLAAVATYYVCLSITKKRVPSFFGGYIFGFSTYEFGHLLGHLNLFGPAFLVSLLVLWSIMFYLEQINTKLFLFLNSLCLAALFLFSIEIFATTSWFISSAIILLYLFGKNIPNDKKIPLTKYTLFSYIICIVLLLPFEYYLLIGFKYAPSLFNTASVYSSDLLNFIIPTNVTWLDFSNKIFINFSGNSAENGSYIGVPLLCVFLMYISRNFSNIYVKFMVCMALYLFICTLGPVLHIDGKEYFLLPWKIIGKLPLINHALPVRFSMFLFLVFAMTLALFLASDNYNIYIKYILAVLSMAFIFPNPVHFNQSYYLNRALQLSFFDSGEYKKFIKPNSNVIIIPFGYPENVDAVAQIKSKFAFNLFSTTWTPVPIVNNSGSNLEVYNALLLNDPQRIESNQFAAFLNVNQVSEIIITQSEYQKWSQTLYDVTGEYGQKVNDIYVYKINFKMLKFITYSSAKLSLFTEMYTSAAKYLSIENNLNELNTKKLEDSGYLDSKYGYVEEDSAKNWTHLGSGWIGKYPCLDVNNNCFGIGVVGDQNDINDIIHKYESSAEQIFFPYPQPYDRTNNKKQSGQLLIVFPFKLKS